MPANRSVIEVVTNAAYASPSSPARVRNRASGFAICVTCLSTMGADTRSRRLYDRKDSSNNRPRRRVSASSSVGMLGRCSVGSSAGAAGYFTRKVRLISSSSACAASRDGAEGSAGVCWTSRLW
jgi:hypothetical protein